MKSNEARVALSRRTRRIEQRRLNRAERRVRRMRRAGAVSVTGLLGTFVLIPAQAVHAAPILIENLNDSGVGSLRSAIAAANAAPGADIVAVKSGLAGTITLTTGDIEITDDLTIAGADAGVGGLMIDAGGLDRALTATTGNLSVSDLTLTNGTALVGGLISVANGDLEVHRSVISFGDGGLAGGAVAVNGDLIVTDSEMKNNVASEGGGTHAGGTTTLTRTTLLGNSASGGDGGGAWSASYIEVTDGAIIDNDADEDGGGLAGEGVTIRGATVSGNTAGGAGGGASSRNGFFVALVDGADVQDNEADVGGGIFSDYSATVIDSTLSGNDASDGSGGGILAVGSVSVLRSTLSDNTSTGRGGALSTQSSASVTETTIAGNTATIEGGALSAYSASIIDSTVSANSAGRSGAVAVTGLLSGVGFTDSMVIGNSAISGAGGVSQLTNYGFASVTNSTVSGNVAAGEGGVFSVTAYGSVSIRESTISDNSSDTGAGAIRSNGGPVSIEGSTISGNSSENGPGGAIRMIGGALTMTDSTISGNAAGTQSGTGEGGAIHAWTPTDEEPGTVTLTDTSISDNGARRGGAVHATRTDVTISAAEGSPPVAMTENRATSNGGAIFATSSPVTLSRVEVTDNSAARSGGAMWSSGTTLSLFDSTVARNLAEFGGGFELSDVDAVITDATFASNESSRFGGGAISATGGVLDVTQSSFDGNSAVARGGAIEGTHGDSPVAATINLTDVEFNDNIAGRDGGALFVDLGDVAAEQTSFVNNSAQNGGAIAIDTEVAMEVTDSTFERNAAAGDGGGIHGEEDSFIDVERSTMQGNEAVGSGGGIGADTAFVSSSTFVDNIAGADGGAIAATTAPIDNSTFHRNSAGRVGGAVSAGGGNNYWNFLTVTENSAGESAGGLWTPITMGFLRNSIVHDNDAPQAPDVSVPFAPRWSMIGDLGPTPTVDADGDVPEGLIVGVDPLLDELADNGGPTLTRLPGARSAAIDGIDAMINSNLASDQRGVDRPIERGADIGAVEYDGPVPVWIPVVPSRLVDTRSSGETIDGRFRGAGTIDADSFVEIDIAGRGGVPGGARGAILNVTAINPIDTGFLTVHPCSEVLPIAASVNYTAGVNLPNEVVAGLTRSGTVCVYSSARVHITVDVVGYVGSSSPLVPVEPSRLLDSRPFATTIDGEFRLGTRVAAGTEVMLDVGGRAGIPVDAAAAVVNVIAVNPGAVGFLTAYSCGPDRPLASSLNFVGDVSRGNEVVTGLDPNGRLCVYASAETDLVVDVMGYLPAGADLTAVEPARVLETRSGTPTIDGEFAGVGRLPAGSVTRVRLAGRASVDEVAATVSMNITAVNASRNGFLTVFPCGDQPLSASLNFVPGVNGGNDVVAGLDAEGHLCIFTSADTDLTVDVTGFTTL